MCLVHVGEALAKACGVAKSRERYVTPRAHTPEVMACALLSLHVDPSEIARVFANSTLSGLKGGTGGGEGCGGDGGGDGGDCGGCGGAAPQLTATSATAASPDQELPRVYAKVNDGE